MLPWVATLHTVPVESTWNTMNAALLELLLVESPEIVQYSGPDAASFYFLNQKLMLRSTENKERGEFQETLCLQILAVPAFFKRS